MTLKEKLLYLKQEGLTIKFIAKATALTESTLYAFSCGARELSKEKAEKLEKFLDAIIAFFNSNI